MKKKNRIIIIFVIFILIIIIMMLIYFKINLKKKFSIAEKNFEVNSKVENGNIVKMITNDLKITDYEVTPTNSLTTNSFTVENIETTNNNNNNNNNSKTIDLSNRTPKNVKVTVIESTISRNGATIVITDNNEVPYTWDENFYRIERKINDEWKDMNPDKPMDSLLIGYIRNENNEIKFEINWTPYYGSLENGIYRILEISSDNTKIYSNEFEI